MRKALQNQAARAYRSQKNFAAQDLNRMAAHADVNDLVT
jgi:hypothetical protein